MGSSQAEPDVDHSLLARKVYVKAEATSSPLEQTGKEAAEDAETPLRRSSRARKTKGLSESFLKLTQVLDEEDRKLQDARVRDAQHVQSPDVAQPDAADVETDVEPEEVPAPGARRSLSRTASSGMEVEMLLTEQNPRKKRRIEA